MGYCTPFLFIFIIIILVVCYFFDLICRLKGTPAIVYIVSFDGLARANYAFLDFAQAIEIIIRRQMLEISSTIAGKAEVPICVVILKGFFTQKC